MSEKRQQHSHTVKSKKNMQKKGVLTHKVGLSYFSLSTEKGQLGNFLIKKNVTFFVLLLYKLDFETPSWKLGQYFSLTSLTHAQLFVRLVPRSRLKGWRIEPYPFVTANRQYDSEHVLRLH